MSASRRVATKIAIMIGQLTWDGSERQLYAFLRHCDWKCWSPTVYVSGASGSWSALLHEMGIPVILLRGNPTAKMGRFRQLCASNGDRRFFSWSDYTNGYGLALMGFHIPCVGSFRNIFPPKSLGRYAWLQSWMSLAAISTAVCNSQETATAVCNRVGNRKRVVYVPNSVQPVENAEVCRTRWRQRLGVSDSESLILGVGRLSPQKNFARFIETVALVNQSVRVRAVVAGRDDGDLSNLRRQIHTSELAPNVVEFIGSVPEARELVCAADVFLLSSDYEGMPNVVMEAMAAGIPCVCTKVNGVSALIKHGVNGFITDHRADALAEKILFLVKNKQLRDEMGVSAMEHMKSNFDPAVIAACLWQLCE